MMDRDPPLQTFIVPPEAAGERLDVFLARAAAPLSRSRLKALIEAGAVTRRGAVITLVKTEIAAGETYTIDMPPPVAAAPQAEAIALDILFEDDDLIVLNKAAGMTVHPAAGAETGTLVHALLHHCQGQLSGIGGVERPGIVHRLDKLTSGVMVAAKSERAHVGLAAQFAAHDLERVYTALVRSAPRPRSGSVEARLARSTADRKKIAVVKNPDSGIGRRAVTNYTTLETYGLASHGTILPAAAKVACTLETGRTHQVRVHMSHIGCPLIGDPVYGKQLGLKVARGKDRDSDKIWAALETVQKFERQALHASVLGFTHPVSGKALRFETRLPEDMARLIKALEAL